MKPRTSLDTLSPLLNKPFFSSKEAKALGVHPALLSYYVKTGHLKRVCRGVYQSSGYQNPLAFQWEDLIEAVYSVKGGVVCLISALAIYDLTEEIPRQHWIAVQHGRSIKKHRNLKIMQFRNMELGKTEIKLEGSLVPIFDRERTLVDAFRLLSREIAIKGLKKALAQGGKKRIDLVKLQAYAKKLRVNILPYLMSFTT